MFNQTTSLAPYGESAIKLTDNLYVNGVLTTGSITTNLPGSTAEGTIHFVEQTKDTSTRTVGIDFFSYNLVGISR